MSLTKYHKKRNFLVTPEPHGLNSKSETRKTKRKDSIKNEELRDKTSSSKSQVQNKSQNTKESVTLEDSKPTAHSSRLKFVVQKHEASHLHFDFRLESEGVLKSWAVPKGPSLDPKEKRLAMEVEDHPFEYRNFEGVIPEGNYGGGTVMLWDEGTYRPLIIHEGENAEEAVQRHLKDGHLKIELYGKKLHGEFAIVKIKNNKFSKGKNAWLLIKHNDEFANAAIEHENVSVRTGRAMGEIAGGKVKKKIVFTPPRTLHEGEVTLPRLQKHVGGVPMPESISPMLASLAQKPFQNEGWNYELKFDGYRALAQIAASPKAPRNDAQVRLYSRNDVDFNDDYPVIVEALSKLKGNMILDGEIVAVDEKGVSKFQLLQEYKNNPKQRLFYYIFDILYFDKYDLRELSYLERRELLEKVIKPNEFLKLSDRFPNGLAMFKSSKKLGFEGIIAKKLDSKYESGRSDKWLKIKSVNEKEFIVGGYTFPKGNRKGFGSLLIGEFQGDKFVFRGHVGTGFNEKVMSDLKTKLDKLERKTSPFDLSTPLEMTKENVAKWINPKIVIQVKFTEWTSDNLLRHPVYLGIRKDKDAKEVKTERVVDVSLSGGENISYEGEIPESRLHNNFLTHPDKVYFPRDNYTKKDLFEYYESMAKVVLPYLIDRPQNMNRHPEGIDGESFFHKDYEQSHPDFVKTFPIYSDSSKKEVDYILCQNEETLLFLANLGCIEINAWNSRVDTLDYPDYILFDLDPEDTPFANVVKVALKLHEMCEKLEIPNFCKTSGKRGLHIYIPLGAKYNFEQVRLFAELFAVKLQKELPDIISLERSPKDRQHKVYIDYLQNRKGQTTSSVYSVRPVDGAPVSTPLLWDEVNSKLDPKKFTIKNTLKRVEEVGDLWKGVLGEGVDIVKVMENLST